MAARSAVTMYLCFGRHFSLFFPDREGKLRKYLIGNRREVEEWEELD